MISTASTPIRRFCAVPYLAWLVAGLTLAACGAQTGQAPLANADLRDSGLSFAPADAGDAGGLAEDSGVDAGSDDMAGGAFCDTCTDDSDCSGGPCVPLGAGSFCGLDCTTDTDCPMGATCLSLGADAGMSCVPPRGECATTTGGRDGGRGRHDGGGFFGDGGFRGRDGGFPPPFGDGGFPPPFGDGGFPPPFGDGGGFSPPPFDPDAG